MTSTAINSQLSTFSIGTATAGAKTLTAATQANPGQFTSTAHGLAVGDAGAFAAVVGMTQLNGLSGIVQYKTANTFTIAGLDTTGFTAYSSAGTFTPQVWTAVANVKTFTGFDGSAAEIDVSNIQSTAKEFLLGLQDPGQFSMEIDLDQADAGQLALLAAQASGAIKQFRLVLPNAKTATFNGYVKKVGAAGGVDQAVKRAVDIRVSGSVVWS